MKNSSNIGRNPSSKLEPAAEMAQVAAAETVCPPSFSAEQKNANANDDDDDGAGALGNRGQHSKHALQHALTS